MNWAFSVKRWLGEGDPHGKFGSAGGQGEEELEEVENMEVAYDSLHSTFTKDINMLAKFDMLDGYINGQL